MTTIARSAGSTIVTLLGTIGSTAGALAKTIDAAASSIDMLDTYVQRAKSNQLAQHTIEDRHWRRNLILENAQIQERIETKIDQEYSTSPTRAARFNSIVADLESLFTETQP